MRKGYHVPKTYSLTAFVVSRTRYGVDQEAAGEVSDTEKEAEGYAQSEAPDAFLC